MAVTLEEPATPICPDFSAEELPAGDPAADWLLEGYLAPGRVTLLSGAWQGVGKTTLVSVLVKRMEMGGSLAGLAVRPGKALVVSEELRHRWRLRQATHHFGDNMRWICRPFAGRSPSPHEWQTLLEHLLQSCRAQGSQLVVVDSLATFLPDERNARLVLEALAQLERLSEAGLAVLLVHRPRPETSPEGFWSPGNAGLCALIDVFLEMYHVSRATAPDRRRKLLGFRPSRRRGG